jgi:hypothetical protein
MQSGGFHRSTYKPYTAWICHKHNQIYLTDIIHYSEQAHVQIITWFLRFSFDLHSEKKIGCQVVKKKTIDCFRVTQATVSLLYTVSLPNLLPHSVGWSFADGIYWSSSCSQPGMRLDVFDVM